MKITPLRYAIIMTIHHEPNYQFLGSEKKAAERMRKMGYLKKVPDGFGHTQGYPLGSYFYGYIKNRYSVTKKGEKAFQEYKKRLSHLTCSKSGIY